MLYIHCCMKVMVKEGVWKVEVHFEVSIRINKEVNANVCTCTVLPTVFSLAVCMRRMKSKLKYVPGNPSVVLYTK